MPNRPCPNCGAETKRLLDFTSLASTEVNYYRCDTCGHVWTTKKDDSEPLRHVTPLSPKGPEDG